MCLFAHYSSNGGLEPSTFHYLKSLHGLGFSVALCSTSDLSQEDIESIKPWVCLVVVRENIGLDFGSWKVLGEIFETQWPGHLEQLEQVVLVNDSVFGPFFSLVPIFESMSRKSVDFWGLTNNLVPSPHVQSYFIVLNRNLVLSRHWLDFLLKKPFFTNKNRLVRECELGFTQKMKFEGYTYQVYCPFEEVVQKSDRKSGAPCLFQKNSTLYLWDILIRDFNFPFLKKEVVRRNPHQVRDFANFQEIVGEVKEETFLVDWLESP